MRYLRILLNAVLAGALTAIYLAILFLQLNPTLPTRPSACLPLVATLLLSYGLHAAVTFYGAIVVWQLLASEPLSPGWLSVRVLVVLTAIAATVGATLMWLNFRDLRQSLDAAAARRMAEGAAALTVAAAVLAMMALVRYAAGRRPGRVGVALFVATVAASVAVPVWLRGPGRAERPPIAAGTAGPVFVPASDDARIIVIALDGASLDYISPAAADGRLPNFGRLLDSGAVAHLATLRPTQPVPVWTAVATGKLPWRTGVRSAAQYQPLAGGPRLDLLPDYCFAHALVYFGFATEQPLTSRALRARPLWPILGDSNIPPAVVRWPLTYPADPLRGVVVSDRLHLVRENALAPDDPLLTYPPDLALTLRLRPEPPAGDDDVPVGHDSAAAGSLATDRSYADVFDVMAARGDARLLVLRFQSLDVAGHYYLRPAMPRSFGDVSEEERRRYGRVLDQYYRYIDGQVGRAIGRLGPQDLLLVVSGFGMEPLTLSKRLLDRVLGSGVTSGTHERAPDGFLLAWGHQVRAGRFGRGSILDVAPTVLYYFGLPIGRDMDGQARTDFFTRDFTEERPVTFIPTYER